MNPLSIDHVDFDATYQLGSLGTFIIHGTGLLNAHAQFSDLTSHLSCTDIEYDRPNSTATLLVVRAMPFTIHVGPGGGGVSNLSFEFRPLPNEVVITVTNSGQSAVSDPTTLVIEG